MQQPARRTNPLSAILSVLLVIALIALAWFVWQWMQEGDRAERLDAEVTTLRQQAANAIAPNSDTDTSIDANDDATTNNDSERIIAAAQTYEKAKPANQGTELQYEIKNREGDFAYVDVTSDMSGHVLILKKVDNQWIVVLSGQQFSQDDLQRYDVPDSLGRE